MRSDFFLISYKQGFRKNEDRYQNDTFRVDDPNLVFVGKCVNFNMGAEGACTR